MAIGESSKVKHAIIMCKRARAIRGPISLAITLVLVKDAAVVASADKMLGIASVVAIAVKPGRPSMICMY